MCHVEYKGRVIQIQTREISNLCYLGYQANGYGMQELHHRQWHVSHMGPVLRKAFDIVLAIDIQCSC